MSNSPYDCSCCNISTTPCPYHDKPIKGIVPTTKENFYVDDDHLWRCRHCQRRARLVKQIKHKLSCKMKKEPPAPCG